MIIRLKGSRLRQPPLSLHQSPHASTAQTCIKTLQDLVKTKSDRLNCCVCNLVLSCIVGNHRCLLLETTPTAETTHPFSQMSSSLTVPSVTTSLAASKLVSLVTEQRKQSKDDGNSLNLRNLGLSESLPVEVIEMIKDEVSRYLLSFLN